jgi:SAM-dependent methyltransferase
VESSRRSEPSAGSGSGPRCPLCDAPSVGPFRDDVRDLEYGVEPARPMTEWRCEACGSEFLRPRPTNDELPTYYPPDYHAYNENHEGLARLLVSTRSQRRARAYADLLGGNRGRIFDVGTGDCRHFDELRDHLDVECAGVEIQPEVAARGRARGYHVLDGTLEEADLTGELGTYDIVSMNHVLEHVVDPGLVMQRAFDLLRPGGHLVGQIPTVTSWEHQLFGRTWGGYHFPRHLQVPSRAGLSRLLAGVGFRAIRLRTAPHIQTTISLQNTLVRAGWHPTMRFGKSPAYGALMALSMPFEAAAWACDRGGIVDFGAAKPFGTSPD